MEGSLTVDDRESPRVSILDLKTATQADAMYTTTPRATTKPIRTRTLAFAQQSAPGLIMTPLQAPVVDSMKR